MKCLITDQKKIDKILDDMKDILENGYEYYEWIRWWEWVSWLMMKYSFIKWIRNHETRPMYIAIIEKLREKRLKEYGKIMFKTINYRKKEWYFVIFRIDRYKCSVSGIQKERITMWELIQWEKPKYNNSIVVYKDKTPKLYERCYNNIDKELSQSLNINK